MLAVILHIVSPNYCDEWVLEQKEIIKNEIIEDIENAGKKAILSTNLLDLILSKTNLIEVKSEIVQLLGEFGVILYEHGNPKEYYIPYLFKGDLSTIYDSNPKDLIIYLYFPDDQVPTSFYFAFISLCLSEFWATNFLPSLGFDCMKFQWEYNYHYVDR